MEYQLLKRKPKDDKQKIKEKIKEKLKNNLIFYINSYKLI